MNLDFLFLKTIDQEEQIKLEILEEDMGLMTLLRIKKRWHKHVISMTKESNGIRVSIY